MSSVVAIRHHRHDPYGTLVLLYCFFKDETQIGDIMRLITKDLSEPYSIYTYRYFIHNWPELCVLAYDTTADCYVGAVVCKLDRNAEGRRKGYLAMYYLNGVDAFRLKLYFSPPMVPTLKSSLV
ncbi:hypothetical protein COOONC_05124 [Cooperia oncophora]